MNAPLLERLIVAHLADAAEEARRIGTKIETALRAIVPNDGRDAA